MVRIPHVASAAIAVFAVSIGVSRASGPFVGSPNMVSTDVVVPGTGRGAGAQGSFWITDLWIRCPGSSPVTLEFHAIDSSTAEATATATVSMTQPVVYLADVIKNTFGLETAWGNIRIVSSTPASANTRTYNRSGGGSYGFGLMAMPSSMAMGSPSMMGGDDDSHRYYVNGLLPEPIARVNLQVVNSGSSPMTGKVEVLDSDGNAPATGARELSFSIQPYSSHEFDGVLAGVHSRFSDDFGLQLRVQLDDTSGGTMMAFAAVIDNVTSDGYVVIGSMMDAVQAMSPGGGMMH